MWKYVHIHTDTFLAGGLLWNTVHTILTTSLVFVDEAWFNLMKKRRRGQTILGQWDIVEVPAAWRQCDTFVAITNCGALLPFCSLRAIEPSSYISEHSSECLACYSLGRCRISLQCPDMGVVHHQPAIHGCLPYIHPFSQANWQPCRRGNLLQAMELACGDIRRCGVLPRLDQAQQWVYPLFSGLAEYCLWCWWSNLFDPAQKRDHCV